MRSFARATIAVAILAALGLSAAAAQTYGMKKFTDTKYGFSFWYPAALKVTVTASSDTASFPGGTLVETLQVGAAGGVVLHVVDSPQSTITDEPNGHAAPIPQTRLFLDAAMQLWMLAYPEGDAGGKPVEAKAADLSNKTIGELSMVGTGARFDTTIIPLTKTRFIVVQDGGGAGFTTQLAATVAAVNAKVAAATQAKALQAEAAAYKK
jgi:hypothetical protein